MRTSQNPFSVYDLLAYLVPGLLSILGTSIILSNKFILGHYTEEFWNVLNIKAFNIENIILGLMTFCLIFYAAFNKDLPTVQFGGIDGPIGQL